ncbi:hypothetical protein [Cutibacterium granulosum]|mgnify:FL=1|nr:hypothetical protein [Cutibacterium granulosum]
MAIVMRSPFRADLTPESLEAPAFVVQMVQGPTTLEPTQLKNHEKLFFLP